MPFLHATTKITGKAYDSLCSDKGYRGFPTLVFMNAEGEVIARPRDRTVRSFVETRDAIERVDGVRERASSGDGHARVELLILEHILGRVRADELATRMESVREQADERQLAMLDQIRIDENVREALSLGYSGEMEKATTLLLVMLREGRLPSDGSGAALSFWARIARHAEQTGDTELLFTAATGIRKSLPDEPGMLHMAERLEEKSRGLRTRDELKQRAASGEAGLEAGILLIELRLSAVTHEAFMSRLAAAKSVATAAEIAELDQGAVDLQFRELSERFWRERNRGETGRALFEILSSDGVTPSRDALGIGLGPIVNWATGSGDPDLMERCAEVLELVLPAGSPFRRNCVRLREQAEKARAGK